MYNILMKKGFTLIELLVVISIISLLSTIVLASLNTARDKAKVAVFVSEVKQFQLALELYKSKTGSYPYEGLDYYAYIYNDVYYDASGIATSLDEYFSEVTPPLIPSFISRFIKFPKEIIEYGYVTTAKDGLEDIIMHDGSMPTLCGGIPIQDIGYYIYFYSSNYPFYPLPFSNINYDGSDRPYFYCVTSS